jgi:hypothetical protein
MQLRSKIYSKLDPPVYKAKLITSWQNTKDIIDAIGEQHKNNIIEAKKICKYFKGSDEIETAKNIFNFLKSEIQYSVEPSNKQTTKSISRFLADGQGDCKHFSLFAATLLQSCGYKVLYRFAGYEDNKIQHVYCYLPSSNIVLDAVLPSFDTEKKPKIKKDIDMSLYSLSGVDQINGLNFNQVKNNIKNAAVKSSNIVKNAASQIPAAADKIKQGMVTAGLAAPRAAFLALVELNFTGLATDFKKIIDQKGDQGILWWVDLGGDRSSFTKSINQGASKKAILSGVDEERDAYDEIYKGYSGTGIGVVVATTAATATPILIKAADVIKKLKAAGVDASKIAASAKQAAATFKNVTGKDVKDVIFKKEAGLNSNSTEIKPADLQPVSTETATKVATAAVAQATGVSPDTITEIERKESNSILDQFKAMSNTKKALIGAGIAGAIYLIAKSR